MTAKTLILHPSRRHPLTGEPLRAIGLRPDGSPLWPIMGGDDTVVPVEPPEGVSAEEWEALGDPGKLAIVRERARAEKAERELAAARARPTPPKPAPKPDDKPKPAPKPGDEPDLAALIQQAVDAAVKPLIERDEQRDAEEAANRVRAAVIEAAKPLLHDPTDALANVDLTTLVDDQGVADADKIKAALDGVVKAKPHLAKSTTLLAPPGIGGGGAASILTEGDKVKAVLAEMQKATGVRPPASTA